MLTLNQIVASAANVDLVEYEALLTRGTKPSKALYRLGVEQQLAGIIGTLKIANTAEEINKVYNDTSIPSCMTTKDVGPFYARHGFSVLHNDRYRVLINLEKEWISERGYGVLCHKLDEILHTSEIVTWFPLEVKDNTDWSEGYEMKINWMSVIKVANKHKNLFVPYIDSFDYSNDHYEELKLTPAEEATTRYLARTYNTDYSLFCDLVPFFEEENFNSNYNSWYEYPTIDFDELRLLGKNKNDQWVYVNSRFGHYYAVNDQKQICNIDYHCEHFFTSEGLVQIVEDLPF